jgi:hypothetical protein
MSCWYSHQFFIERPNFANTRWWIDLFLFDTIVRECLIANAKDIDIWRIHRRGQDDATGHKFSFLYYSSKEVFKTIESSITDHGVVKVLQKANFLRDLSHVEIGAKIEATSDNKWPLPLQKTWPYYIMGVSQMALELVDNLRHSPRPAYDVVSINDCETYYTLIMNRFIEVWQNWGSHAFFHHINAVFGFMPVVAQPRQVSGVLAVF